MASLIDGLPVSDRVPTVTAAQMAEVDRAAVDELGLSTEMLMENAARGVADAAAAILGGSRVVRSPASWGRAITAATRSLRLGACTCGARE